MVIVGSLPHFRARNLWCSGGRITRFESACDLTGQRRTPAEFVILKLRLLAIEFVESGERVIGLRGETFGSLTCHA